MPAAAQRRFELDAQIEQWPRQQTVVMTPFQFLIICWWIHISFVDYFYNSSFFYHPIKNTK